MTCDNDFQSFIGSSSCSFIGVDLEELEGVKNKIPENAYDMIGTGPELRWVKADTSLSEVRIKMLFSAKEAAFKALFPHEMEYLDFKKAIFQWDYKKGFFRADF